jgi:hypothetical protein
MLMTWLLSRRRSKPNCDFYPSTDQEGATEKVARLPDLLLVYIRVQVRLAVGDLARVRARVKLSQATVEAWALVLEHGEHKAKGRALLLRALTLEWQALTLQWCSSLRSRWGYVPRLLSNLELPALNEQERNDWVIDEWRGVN